MLTQATIELDPGDKRHLKVTLPKGGIFWFASVNSVSARPWKEGDDLLIPLEKPLEAGQPTLVSFTYSTPDTGRRLPKGFRLVGPAFDLPLQDIRWTIQLPEGRRVRELSDAWQYEQQLIAQEEQVMEIDSYLMRQKSAQQEKTKKAESLLNFGNNLLQEGDQQRARKAFNSAYNLSQHDDAFNEDARVQLQNLKKQQALVGLVNRRGNAFMEQQGQQAEGGVQLQLKTDINGPKYSEREFKQVLANNAPEVNGALVQLAEQLINQQEATLTVPEGIHAELPIHREQHVFTRSIMIDDGAVALEIETETEKLSGAGMRVGLMINLAILFAALAFVSHPGRAREE